MTVECSRGVCTERTIEGALEGCVRSRFYWRGHGEVTKKYEVKGQRAEAVRGHRIPTILLRGHQNHS